MSRSSSNSRMIQSRGGSGSPFSSTLFQPRCSGLCAATQQVHSLLLPPALDGIDLTSASGSPTMPSSLASLPGSPYPDNRNIEGPLSSTLFDSPQLSGRYSRVSRRIVSWSNDSNRVKQSSLNRYLGDKPNISVEFCGSSLALSSHIHITVTKMLTSETWRIARLPVS